MGLLNQLAIKPLRRVGQQAVGPIGFDLAIERLNMLQLEKDHNDFKLRAVASIKYPTNREELMASAGDFRAFVREALKTKPFKGKKIVSCLPGHKTKIINLSYKLPAGQDETRTIIKEVMSRLDDKADDYVMDYLPIRVEVKASTQKKALVAVSKRKDVISYLELLAKAGLNALALEIGPVALRRLVVSLDYPNKYPTVLIVNFGRSNSYITVLSGRRLMLDEKLDFGEDKLSPHLDKSLMMEREVGFGENMLVTQLSRALQTDEGHAHKLLYEYGFGNDIGDARAGSMTTAQHEIIQTIREILKPLFLELVDEVNKVLIYTASETRGGSIERVYLLGSVARYPGAAPFMSDILSIPGEVLNPFARFATCSYHDLLEDCYPVVGIALATGLALRGVYSYG